MMTLSTFSNLPPSFPFLTIADPEEYGFELCRPTYRRICVSGPMQFEPMLFKGQL